MAPSFDNTAIAAKILTELPHRDREVLTRFYLLKHSPEEIQESLGIDQDEFSQIKARAKRRFFDIIAGRDAPLYIPRLVNSGPLPLPGALI